jgi:hypothetical protein
MSVRAWGAGTRMAGAAALAGLLLCHGGLGAAAADLEALRAAWSSARTPEQYGAAVAALIDYRTHTRFAKTPEIDYMIATGLCRIPGREADGARIFDWIFDHYNLAPDEEVISRERDSCGRQTAKAIVTFAMMAGQGGSAGVHGKLFYWLGRQDAAVSSDPIEVVERPTAEDLRARLFNLDSLQAAESAARHRLGANFTVAGADGFVLAGAGGYTPEALRDIAERLGKFGSFYVGAFGLRAPKKLVTVYLVPDPDQMVGLARKLHGLRIPDSMIGYSFPTTSACSAWCKERPSARSATSSFTSWSETRPGICRLGSRRGSRRSTKAPTSRRNTFRAGRPAPSPARCRSSAASSRSAVCRTGGVASYKSSGSRDSTESRSNGRVWPNWQA